MVRYGCCEFGDLHLRIDALHKLGIYGLFQPEISERKKVFARPGGDLSWTVKFLKNDKNDKITAKMLPITIKNQVFFYIIVISNIEQAFCWYG